MHIGAVSFKPFPGDPSCTTVCAVINNSRKPLYLASFSRGWDAVRFAVKVKQYGEGKYDEMVYQSINAALFAEYGE